MPLGLSRIIEGKQGRAGKLGIFTPSYFFHVRKPG